VHRPPHVRGKFAHAEKKPEALLAEMKFRFPDRERRLWRQVRRDKLYPICDNSIVSTNYFRRWVDQYSHPVHFWDPMLTRFIRTGFHALESAAMPLAGSMMFTTIITTTTRMRGASG
jgi:hypothetical protein